ncbi:hypothetical protein KAR91_52840 [Candidatus Pacearchaeota archaeon]|nr:hypothetical protein [Candidatus Pacearchaeota archaeon]
MNNKKHVKDFITNYFDYYGTGEKQTERSGLLAPLLAQTFKYVPRKYWYDIDCGSKGSDMYVTVFNGRFSNPIDPKSRKEKAASVYFHLANFKLYIETSIDITEMTIKDLSKIIIAQIVASRLEGKNENNKYC